MSQKQLEIILNLVKDQRITIEEALCLLCDSNKDENSVKFVPLDQYPPIKWDKSVPVETLPYVIPKFANPTADTTNIITSGYVQPTDLPKPEFTVTTTNNDEPMFYYDGKLMNEQEFAKATRLKTQGDEIPEHIEKKIAEAVERFDYSLVEDLCDGTEESYKQSLISALRLAYKGFVKEFDGLNPSYSHVVYSDECAPCFKATVRVANFKPSEKYNTEYEHDVYMDWEFVLEETSVKLNHVRQVKF